MTRQYNGFFDWFCDIKKDEPVQFIPMDTSIIAPIQEVKPKKIKAKKAPTSLSLTDYIGQTKVKTILQAYFNSKTKVLPHVLIHGAAGNGKTTLARIIAKERGVKFTEIMAQSVIDGEQLVSLIKSSAGGILFIDEIHGLGRDTVEIIYSMMEDFKCNGTKIKPFTLIGATTEYGELLKDRRPFVDRFKINLELESYNCQEIEELTNKFVKRTKLNVDDNSVKAISENSKLTPRLAIRLAEATDCFNGDVNKAIYSYNIVKNGLTEKDIKTLKYLNVNKKAGINSISAYLNTPIQSYRYEIEPYLLQIGYILVVPGGRQITQLGRQFLASLNQP